MINAKIVNSSALNDLGRIVFVPQTERIQDITKALRIYLNQSPMFKKKKKKYDHWLNVQLNQFVWCCYCWSFVLFSVQFSSAIPVWIFSCFFFLHTIDRHTERVFIRLSDGDSCWLFFLCASSIGVLCLVSFVCRYICFDFFFLN